MNRKLFLILFLIIIILSSCINKNIENKETKNNPLSSSAVKKIKTDEGIEEKNDKIIYLTFDDGPSKVTLKILDILNSEKVKATFFIVGKEIEGNEYILKKIYNEGHSIGLHSFSHDLKKIYSNNDVFIEEMLKTQEKIKNITGISPNIIRFPGGSKGHLDDLFLDKLHSYNFKIYDWNISCEDGTNPKASPEVIYKNATRFKKPPKRIILLLHSGKVNKTTPDAVLRIIKYYKNKGYTFKIIDSSTPEYIFKYKKVP